MKLYEAQELAITLMTEHRLNDWSFEFDYSISRFGATNFNNKKITLSKTLTELNTIDHVKNMILHEIAHAKAGMYAHHNKTWQQIALSIGCDGNRLYNNKIVITPLKKYIATCPNGHTVHYNRKKKLSCVKCCPQFNKKYLFKFTINPEYK